MKKLKGSVSTVELKLLKITKNTICLEVSSHFSKSCWHRQKDYLCVGDTIVLNVDKLTEE